MSTLDHIFGTAESPAAEDSAGEEAAQQVVDPNPAAPALPLTEEGVDPSASSSPSSLVDYPELIESGDA